MVSLPRLPVFVAKAFPSAQAVINLVESHV